MSLRQTPDEMYSVQGRKRSNITISADPRTRPQTEVHERSAHTVVVVVAVAVPAAAAAVVVLVVVVVTLYVSVHLYTCFIIHNVHHMIKTHGRAVTGLVTSNWP